MQKVENIRLTSGRKRKEGRKQKQLMSLPE
jgi:hypothetical protein